MIAIDIGNSSVKIGYYQYNKFIVKRYLNIDNIPVIKNEKFIVSSVDPIKEKKIKKRIKGEFANINVEKIKEIIFKYKDMKTLGQDRVAAIYSAYKKYTGGTMVVDFGTAITIDFLSSNNIYSGGIIFPGPLTIIDCLEDRTAQLKKHNFKITKEMGLSTFDCIDSGITNAIIGLIERTMRINNIKVGNLVFTGGYGKEFMEFFKEVIFDEHLVLEGLIEYGREYG